MSSAAELELRQAAVAFFHQEAPTARVIHELNVGGCRADLAVVEPSRLILAELKSSRDTLTRLARQVLHFTRAAHETIVIADARWWKTMPDGRGGEYINPVKALSEGAGYHAHRSLWHYPAVTTQYRQYEWRMPKLTIAQPHATRLLEVLWKQELLDAAAAAGIPTKTRWPCKDIIDAMIWGMTGEAIARAACTALRRRPFVEADAPL
jgi:hypothetical protein